MRAVSLGHWQIFTWHLPSAGLMCIGLLLAARMTWTLFRSRYDSRTRAKRWNIVGWCVLWSTLFAPMVWPYLRAPAQVTVLTDGTWVLRNYLGLEVGRVPGNERRRVRAVNLGGRGVGTGVLEIEREDGTVVRTVRVNRETVRAFSTTLGYDTDRLRTRSGDLVFPTHRFTANGPVDFDEPLALRQ